MHTGMKMRTVSCTVVTLLRASVIVSMLLSSIGTTVAVRAAALPVRQPALHEVDTNPELLPAWMSSAEVPSLLPAWMPAAEVHSHQPANLRAPGPGACPADATQVAMDLMLSPGAVSRGDVAGQVYTVTVTNNSSTVIPEVRFVVTPAPGFAYVGSSAAVTSNISGTLLLDDPGSAGSGSAVALPIDLDSPSDAIAAALDPGETITLTFRLSTDADAESGQRLDIDLVSGDTPPATCQTIGDNVSTVRGNLVISKLPKTQDGSYADVVTWTVELRNTGLGTVYGATFTDVAGAGLSSPVIDPLPGPIDLASEESRTYTVTSQILACTNLTNSVVADWSIGNADGTGIPSDPVRDDVDIVFLLEEPDISVAIGELPTVDFCGSVSAVIPVTVTNSGGAGRNLTLQVDAQALTIGDPGADWTLVGTTLTYTGGDPVGAIMPGEILTLEVPISIGAACATRNAALSFTASVWDACDLLQDHASSVVESVTLAPDAVTLSVDKTGPGVVAAGDVFDYVVTASGANQQNIGASGLTITDVVPVELDILSYQVSAGTAVITGNTLVWDYVPTGTGDYRAVMTITVEVPNLGEGICGAGGSLVNTAQAVVDVCPECRPLTATAEQLSYIEDFLGEGNSFDFTSTPIEVCATSTQLVSSVLTINDGITWTNTVYTDALGAGSLDVLLDIVPGTPRVVIDGQDRTGDVVITEGPTLTIDFSPIGTYSDTTVITITYEVIADVGSIPDDESVYEDFWFVQFYTPPDSDTLACGGGGVAYFGNQVRLERGNLTADIGLDVVESCRVNDVTITVPGGNDRVLVDNVVVTFTAGSTDIFTPSLTVLGGAFSGQTPVISTNGNAVTYTFGSALALTQTGTIEFPLFRNCGEMEVLRSGVSYQDRCNTSRSSFATGGGTTHHSNATLFSTPDAYTVIDDTAHWRFYVGSLGDIEADDVLVTNTLPAGHVFTTYEISSTTHPGIVASIVGVTDTLPNGQAVITFTIPVLPVGGRVRFDMNSRIDDACNLPADIQIALTEKCGQVGGVCQDREEEVVQLLPARYSLLSSNDQVANLPLCEAGTVDLVVKNTSASAKEYDFTIVDVITNGLYVEGSAYVTVTDIDGNIVTGATSGQVLANQPFTPSVSFSGNRQELEWSVGDFLPATVAYDVLAERAASDVIRIRFDVKTGCDSDEVQVQSLGQAMDVCGKSLPFQENAKTLITAVPDLAVDKLSCNAATTDCSLPPANFADSIAAGAGETVVWWIQVTNNGGQRVTNLYVTDTVPSNYTIVDFNEPSYVSVVAGNTVSWVITSPVESPATILAPNGGTREFVITGTVDNAGCVTEAVNRARAMFDCGGGGGVVCSGGSQTDAASMSNVPEITVDALDATLNQCGGGPLEIEIFNTGAYAENVVVSYTLPSGIAYGGDAGTAPASSVLYAPAVGATGVITWLLDTVTQSLTAPAATILFTVTNDPGSCSVIPLTPPPSVDASYSDSCGNLLDDVDQDGANLTIQRVSLVGNLSGALQRPITRVVSAGELYTWTIGLRNDGSGAAYNVVLTDTLEAGYTDIAGTVSTGTGGGADVTPVVAGQVITWPIGTLNAGGTFEAQLVARIVDNPTELGITLDASSECDSGGCLTATLPFNKYATALEDLEKTVSAVTIPVGLPFSYTVYGDFFGDYVYAAVVLTDVLPVIEGQVAFSATEVLIENNNAGNTWEAGPLGGDVITFTTSGSPAGQVSGPETITFTVTGVISNSSFADNGDTFANSIELVYSDDGQAYRFERVSADTTVVEPVLSISKVATPTTGLHAGDRVTYTISADHTGESTSTAYDVVITDTIPGGLTLVPGSVETVPSVTGLAIDDHNITATYEMLALGTGPLVITYVVVADANLQPNSTLVNEAVATWTSTADDPVGEERSGGGDAPDDYDDDTTAPIQTEKPEIGKTILGDSFYTIGDPVTYGVRLPLPAGVIRNIQVTDTLPVGLRYLADTAQLTANGVSVQPPDQPPTFTLVGPNDGVVPTSLVWDVGTVTNPVGSPIPLVITLTAVVVDQPANQQGVSLTNTVLGTWLNDLGETQTVTDTVDLGLLEPTLVIEKSVDPSAVTEGDTVFYTIRLYHAVTSTVPAYNVTLRDVVPAELQYIFNSWSQSSGPVGALSDAGAPELAAAWDMIPTTTTQSEPIVLRYGAVVSREVPPGTLVTNTVTTTWTSTEEDPYGEQRDYDSDDDAQVSIPEVALDKTGPLTVVAGLPITYIVSVSNVGPFAAAGAVVTDVMPFQVDAGAASYVVDGGSSGACAITPQVAGDAVVCDMGGIPADPGTATITITGVVDPDTPEGADLTNRAELTVTSPDGETLNNQDEVETEVLVEGDVGVEKTGPATVIAGETVTYSIVASNTGPSTSRDVDIKDLLPPGFTFVAGSSTTGACVAGICQLGDLAVGEVVTMVVTATVGSDVAGGTGVVNTAQVFSDTPDPNPDNDTDEQPGTVAALTALQIAKVDLTDPVYAGQTYFYEIVVTNTGPSDAQAVVVTDTLPSDYVSFEGASPECSHAGGIITCSIGTLVAAETRDFLINVRVNSDVVSPTTGTNVVAVTTTTTLDLANSILNDTEETTYLQPVGALTDLALTKSVDLSSAVAGRDQVTYTLVVTNNGPSPASAVRVVDAYPREFDFVRASTTKDTTASLCNNGGTCDLGEMVVGAVVTITMVLDVPSDVVGGSYINTAHVSSPAAETTLVNNTDDVPVTVTELANLEIAKLATPNPAVAGERLTYHMIVTNTGPSDADNVTVSDIAPGDFSTDQIVSSQGGCTNLPCNLGTLPAGGNADVTVIGTVSAGATDLTNTATVTSTTPGTGDTDTVVPVLGAAVDLVLQKRATPTAEAGGSVLYELTVTNNGPSVAQNVRVTDTLPEGVVFVDAGTGCAGAGPVVCTQASLTPGATVVFTIAGTVNSDVLPGTNLENVAIVTSDQTDLNPGNNQDDADTSIVGSAELALSKTQVTTGAVLAGDLVTYIIAVTNTGPGLARSVDVKDQLPAGLTLESIAASDGGICGGSVCQFGTLPVDAVRTITVVARVDSNAAAGTVANLAGAYSTDDPTPVTATVETEISTQARLRISKVDLQDPVGQDEGFLYQIVVTNDGPSDADDVVVTDTLDAGVTFGSASAECRYATGLVVCDLGTVAAGTSESVLIGVRANGVASGTVLLNEVEVDALTPLDAGSVLTDDETTRVTQLFGPEADVAIDKATPQELVVAGDLITYTLDITNDGPATATNARVLELVPVGTQVVDMSIANPDDSTAYCSLGGSCYVGTVTTQTTAVITVVLQVDSDFDGSQLLNSASVSADQPDGDPDDNIDSVTSGVMRFADLAIEKRDLMDPVNAGDLVLYELSVVNNGPSAVSTVVITDTLPDNTTYAGSSAFCTVVGREVTCALGALDVGERATVLLQVRTPTTLPTGSLVVNSAGVVGDAMDFDNTNNADDESTIVNQPEGGPVDLVVDKAGTPAVVVAGNTVTYTLVVTNAGPGVALDVTVVDALPEGLSAVAVTASQGTCNSGVTCLLGDLAVDATATITVVALVDSAQMMDVMNWARVTSANPELDDADNYSDEPTSVTVEDGLGIIKRSPATVEPGAALAYQIVVSNAGPSDATAVVISDTLPAEIENAIASSSQGSCAITGRLLTCRISRLAVDEQVFVLVQGNVSTDAGGVVVNTASVTSDADPDGEQSTVTTTVIGYADLALQKQATPTVYAGEQVLYELTVTNNGPSEASGVWVTDTLPPALAFDTAATACSETVPGTVVCGLEYLAAGASATFTIAVTVDSSVLPGTSLENAAIVTGDQPDPNPVDNRDDADTSILGLADLGIDKRDDPATVVAGQLLTYTMVVTNYGPSDAVNVELFDGLPSQVTLVSAEAAGGFCSGAICFIPSLTAGTSTVVTMVTRVRADVAPGTIIYNIALVSSDTPSPSPDPHANVDTETTDIVASADLGVIKSHLGVAVAGEQLTYRIVVANHGPSAAESVVVTDTLPLGLTYVADTDSCVLASTSPDVLRCQLGDLAVADETMFEVTVAIAADVTGTVTNTAEVVSPVTTDPNPANDEDTDPATVSSLVDLRLFKTEGFDPVTAGTLLTYTLTVLNDGPSDAVAVVVTDTLPSEVAYVTDTVGCTVAAGDLICPVGDLADGARASFQVVVRVNPDVLPGATIFNEAVVGSDTPEENLDNNVSDEPTGIVGAVDVILDKTGTPPVVYAGEAVTYTIVVTNAGPSVAEDVDVKDFLPTGVTALSAEVHTGEPCLPTLCQLGNMDAGEVATITLVAEVDTDLISGTLENRAQAYTDTPDTNPDNNSDAWINTVTSLAQLQIDKRDLVDPTAPDTVLIYAIAVSNTGPSVADNVVVTDVLPPEVSYLGNTDGCVEGPAGILTCGLGSLAVDETRDFLVTVRVHADVVSGTVLLNRASVTSTTPLTQSVLTDTETTDVEQQLGLPADLAVVKVADPTTVVAGEQVTYTIVVTNYGPAAATDVEITDALPSGLTQVRAMPSQGACDGSGYCYLGTLPFNGTPTTATVTLVAVVSVDVAPGTVLTNSVLTRSDMPDPNPDNNVDQEPIDVVAEADLTVVKSDSPDPVVAGELLSYEVLITNNGPSDAAGVVVTDTLPVGTSFVAAEGCILMTARTVVCTIGELPAGENAARAIVVTVAPTVTGALLNSVVVDAETPDLNPQNNVDEEPTAILSEADVSIVKTVNAAVVAPGDRVTYTLTVRNAGPSDAQDVTVEDVLPAAATYVTATPPSLTGATPLRWMLGTLAVDETSTIEVVAQVATSVDHAFLLVNTAVVTSSTPDVDPDNNTDTADVQAVREADVEVIKSARSDTVHAGETVTYTIEVHNDGPSDAADVDVKDLLPDGLTLDELMTSQGACVGELCQLGDLVVSETVLITAVVTVDPDVVSGTMLCNSAIDFADTYDPNPDNNEDDACIVVTNETDVSITKTGPATVVPGGEDFAYTLLVTNNGPSDAEQVMVVDTLPDEAVFVDAVPAPLAGPNPLVWNLGLVPADEVREITIWMRLPSDVVDTITNTAVVTTTTPDADPTNNDDDHPIEPTPLADLRVDKRTVSSPVVAGALLTYTITITNDGPSDAVNVVLSDTLPNELIFVSASPLPATGPSPLTWEFALLTPGEAREVVVVVRVDRGAVDVFENVASVTSATPDPESGNNDDVEPNDPLVPDIAITKSVLVDEAAPGMPIRYVLSITNTGEVTLDPVQVRDTLPDGFAYIAGSGQPTDPDTVMEPLLVWDNVGPLDPDASTQLAFAVRAPVTITRGIHTNLVDVVGTDPGGTVTDTDDVPVVIADPSIMLDKRAATLDRDNLVVTFTIAITNTGPTTIDTLPLVDTYDPDYLSFVSAVPAPDEPDDDGALGWDDLTGPLPTGFDRPLLPGETFVVTTVFEVVQDITVTVNTAVVDGAEDAYDNPVPPEEDEEEIEDLPTWIDLLSFEAASQADGTVLITWATAVEVNNFGFRLLRATAADVTLASELVFAPSKCAGNQCGATYDYLDTDAQAGQRYWYWLVDVDTDGFETRHGPVTAGFGVKEVKMRLFLPLVIR